MMSSSEVLSSELVSSAETVSSASGNGRENQPRKNAGRVLLMVCSDAFC